jgi:hypothetical protein
MNQFFRTRLKQAIDYLQSIYDRQTEILVENPPYSALSPTNQAEGTTEYRQALDWALKNRKNEDIKNIALTGPYGSGKSSILKTYINTNKDKSLHFLPISLATFKEEEVVEESSEGTEKKKEGGKNGNTKSGDTDKNDLLRLIELSILQQIFYHEEDRKIPDSRFRKIKNFSRKELWITTGLLMLVIISLTHLIYPTLIETQFKLKASIPKTDAMHWVALVCVLVGAAALIYKSIRLMSSVKISKLNFQNAEINIGDHISKSILNHHLDEILYFFQVTPYNVVVIEDLDRFRQTDIFTKLREINLLVNNSAKIKKDVVFIYAVRDDMFKEDNERTKFFDFIIPVIPVINPSNSSQKLLDKKEKWKFNISENLIDSLSMFIDDMRLLHNITNEYYLYHQKLNKTLTQDKLLAIIVYKNLFPNDFTDLSHSKGKLYMAITDKNIYITQETEKVQEQIKAYKSEIKELEQIKIKDVIELRYSYLLHIVETMIGFNHFSKDGGKVSIKDMASDENFNALRTGKAEYDGAQYYNNNVTKKVALDFKAIEDKVDKSKSYEQRKKQIDDINNNRIDSLKKQISESEKTISQLRNLKVRELLEKGNIEINLAHEKQKKIVNILLRDGFIDEDYLDYVSIFYEGSITKEDNQFLLNIKSRINTPFNHKLARIENLLKKINLLDFDKHYVFNSNLMDFILAKPAYIEHQSSMLTKLADRSTESLAFINDFLNNGKNIDLFIKELVKKWPGIWEFIDQKSLYDEERKTKYFKFLIEFADLTDLQSMYQSEAFKNTVLAKKDFLSIIPDSKRLEQIIEELKIKFTDLTIDYSPESLLDFIYLNNFYKINPVMLKLILAQRKGLSENDFNTQNYYAISKSHCVLMAHYINDNLDEYISDVYLELPDNNQEHEEELLKLLNSDQLSEEIKARIIKQVLTRISDLSKISDVNVKLETIEQNKVVPTWNNVFDYYQADGSTGINFLETITNDDSNLKVLAAAKIPKDEDPEIKTYRPFIHKILSHNAFTDIVYNELLDSVPYRYPNLDFSDMNQEKVAGLIDKHILSFNVANYDQLKETKAPLHLAFLKMHKAAYIADLEPFKVDGDDLLNLLQSEKFTSSEKNILTERADETIIISSGPLLQKIGELILRDNSFRVSPAILQSILVTNSLSVEQRVRIFAWKHEQITPPFTDFLNALHEPYSEITINGKRPMLSPTEYNQKLADVLQSRGYISSYDISEKGIRIATFTKEQE